MIPKAGIKVVPSRVGKNYFLKYLIESQSVQSQISRRMEGPTPQDAPIATLDPNRSLPHQPYHFLEESMAIEPSIEQSYVEMIVVLLSQVYSSIEVDKTVGKLVSSFLLSDIVADYKESFDGITLPITQYSTLESTIQALKDQNSKFARGKYLSIATLHRLLSFRLEIWIRAQGDHIKKKKKVNTQSRVERLVFVWKKVKEHQKISMIDLSYQISKDLERDMAFKIDKKTIVKLVSDLEKIKVAKTTVFKITIESQKILDNKNTFCRTMVSDAFVRLSDKEIGDDPCIKNPTFKRDSILPVSLEFLINESDKQPKSSAVLASKRPRILDSIFDGEIEKGQVDPRDKIQLSRSEKLTKIAKVVESKSLRSVFTRLKVANNRSMLSQVVADAHIPHSVTDTFLQSKMEVSTDLILASQLILFSSNDHFHLNSKPESTKRDHKIAKVENSVTRYFDRIDDSLAKLEDDQVKDVRQGSALAYPDNIDKPPMPSSIVFVPKIEGLMVCMNGTTDFGASPEPIKQQAYEEYEDWSTLTKKQVETNVDKVINTLKRGRQMRKEELINKLKSLAIAEAVICQLTLQNDIEEVKNLDGESIDGQVTLRLMK